MTQVVTNSRPSPRYRPYPIRVNPSYKVGICALFAQIPGEGASPRVGASWKGIFTFSESALVERPLTPTLSPQAGEREQKRRATFHRPGAFGKVRARRPRSQEDRADHS